MPTLGKDLTLNPPTYQTVPVTCPGCQNRFATPIMTIVDATENPGSKGLLLSGQLNIAVCPQCGQSGMLSTPLVYHDADKEFIFTFVPGGLSSVEADQQQIIGELTNRLISGLPAEKRRGYLFRPRAFLRLESLIEAVLEADGIAPDMLRAQRARAELLGRLLATKGEDLRQVIASESDAQIDYEFYQLLTVNLQMAKSEGRSEDADGLARLRAELLEWTTLGQQTVARQEASESLGSDMTREDVIESLVAAAQAREQIKIEAIVIVARQVIDYVFYQRLTGRIEAAEAEGSADVAQDLRALRETVLNLTARIDKEVEQATRKAAGLLAKILESDDPEPEIRANLDQIDDLFLAVLGTNLEVAEKADQTEAVRRLERVADVLMRLIRESQPPEILLINDLMSAEYPDGTRLVLDEHRERVNDALLNVIDRVEKDLSERGQSEPVEHLRKVRAQAAAIVGSARK